ncbi:MAG: 1,4-dihydroxy-2-naphthoate octaprenyltransferase [Bacteroidales bacterium]|nr:1,4-dihydroxy-2-naphthoate octaprenyltransferase [Bacteroidales bacterium]
MNKTIKAAIFSMRLRTLPLSLAGVVLGMSLALKSHEVSVWLIVWLLLTTVCLQILSNLCNELGDFLKGTDGEQREGPMYSLAQGAIGVRDFKILVVAFVVLCCGFGAAMIWASFSTFLAWQPIMLLLLGVAAIWAAMHYTLGKNPYGYKGLGDVFVFIFFGLVSVLGSYYVVAHTIDSWSLLLPAITIGCFSVGVLNVNNIRDMESDAATRVSLPLKIGAINAKIFQSVLIVLGWLCMILYTMMNYVSLWNLLYIITLPLFLIHMNMVWKRNGKALDSALPLLVISTFVFALLAGI